MRTLTYALLHLRRSRKSTLITLCSYLAVLALILSVQQSVHSRQHALSSMAAAIDVQCVAADNAGVMTTNLRLGPFYYSSFLEAISLGELARDVWLKSANSTKGDGFACQLYGTTCEDADESLRYASSVFYDEGYDDNIWMTEKSVCVISPDLAAHTYISEDGHTCIDITGSFYSDFWQADREVTLTLRVIGSVYAYGSIYAPFKALKQACDDAQQSISFTADSMSFFIQDNQRLDALAQPGLCPVPGSRRGQ